LPAGVVHFQYYKKFFLLAFGIGCGLMVYNFFIGLGFLIGYFVIGRYCSPDNDLIGMNLDDGRLMRELKIFGAIIVMWMTLYAYIGQIFGGHRSKFSHSYFFSTAIRIIWIFGIPLFIWYWNYLPITNEILFTFLGIFLGNSMSDGIHIYLDFHS